VVERREVDQFDDRGRRDHLVRIRAGTHLRAEEGEQRAEALPARVDEVQGGLGDELVATGHLAVQELLDAVQPRIRRRREVRVAEFDSCDRVGCHFSTLRKPVRRP
jgi:hypothetical protein